jgi:hypothetical protein
MKPAYFAGGWPVKERIFDGRNADAPSAFLESHAKARKVGDRVPQLSKAFWGSEGVMECTGLAELWMGIERVDGEIQSGVKPPQSKKEGSGISRGDAETRRVGIEFRSCPRCFGAMRVSWSAPA